MTGSGEAVLGVGVVCVGGAALRWGPEAFAYEQGWERLRGLLRNENEGER